MSQIQRLISSKCKMHSHATYISEITGRHITTEHVLLEDVIRSHVLNLSNGDNPHWPILLRLSHRELRFQRTVMQRQVLSRLKRAYNNDERGRAN